MPESQRNPEPKRRSTLRQDALNLPNALTMMRIVMIPAILYLLQKNTLVDDFFALAVYAATAITDFFDGYLARRQNLVSLVGKFLDPLADKLLVMALLVQMVEMDRVATWVVIVILAREFTVTSLRVIAMSEGLTLEASRGGKDKAAIQMIAIGMLIGHRVFHLDFIFFELDANFHEVGIALLYLSVWYAISSAYEYCAVFARAVNAKSALP